MEGLMPYILYNLVDLICGIQKVFQNELKQC